MKFELKRLFSELHKRDGSFCVILMMLLTTVNAWADNVTYIDENGDTQYCSNFTILDNSMNDLAEGWYVVNSDVTYNGDLETNGDGDVNIILCDGATLTANNITPKGHKDRLRIYGQSQGTGTANISGSITGNYSLTINGGTINANILDGDQGSVGINGGTVNVTGDIKPYGGVSFNGGNVIVTGEVEAGNYGNIFLSGGTVKASSYSASKGNVYISKGLTYYDGTGASYTGTEELTPGYLNLTSIEIDAIAGKTLRTFDYRGGTCGDPNVNEGKNVTWLYNIDTHTLTISGTGAMADYEDANYQPWVDKRDKITSIVIEEGVTSIGNYAFSNFEYVTSSVSIPASVTSIGNYSFNYSSMPSVTFAANSALKTIGSYAFNCTSLTSVTLPASVTNISNSAFDACPDLATVILNSNPVIGEQAFNNAAVTMNLTANGPVDEKYWTTFYNENYSFTADDNTTIYKGKVNGNSVQLTEVDDIPADNAAILKSTASPIVLTLTTTASGDFTDNDLKGAKADTDASEMSYAYCLSNGSNGVGFYKYTGNGVYEIIPANRAYLIIVGSNSAPAYNFLGFDEDDATSLSEELRVKSEESIVYDLQGRKVDKPTHGLYIVNGKKVLIK